jgi:DNA-binding NarL/FixJ family response regulator
MGQTSVSATIEDYVGDLAKRLARNGVSHEIVEHQTVSSSTISDSGDEPKDVAVYALQIALVDSYTLTRDCLLRAVSDLPSEIVLEPFRSVEDFISTVREGIDLVIFYSHASYTETLHNIGAIRVAFGVTPLIIISDLDNGNQNDLIRGALRAGANGFISARTTSLPMTLSAIRFVHAGGSIAPLDMLLSDNTQPSAVEPETEPAYRLTARQRAVLAQLQQGKANKIIAHELGMSESTAKVHIRNIMRKMGATNRTQAAFNALRLCPDVSISAEI